jgi:hypothetical protein
VSILKRNPVVFLGGPITQKPKPPQEKRVCKKIGHGLPVPTRMISCENRFNSKTIFKAISATLESISDHSL